MFFILRHNPAHNIPSNAPKTAPKPLGKNAMTSSNLALMMMLVRNLKYLFFHNFQQQFFWNCCNANPNLIAKANHLWLRRFISIILNPLLRVTCPNIENPENQAINFGHFYPKCPKSNGLVLRIFNIWSSNTSHGGVYKVHGKKGYFLGTFFWGFGGNDDL